MAAARPSQGGSFGEMQGAGNRRWRSATRNKITSPREEAPPACQGDSASSAPVQHAGPAPNGADGGPPSEQPAASGAGDVAEAWGGEGGACVPHDRADAVVDEPPGAYSPPTAVKDEPEEVVEAQKVETQRVEAEDMDAVRERLLKWTLVASERFEGGVYVRELVGQFTFALLGPLAIPLLRMYYGSWIALKNRLMVLNYKPHACCREKLFLAMPMVVTWTTSLSFCCSLAFWFTFQPEEATPTEISIMCLITLLRCNTIAIKYAHFPKPAYKQFDTEVLSSDRLSSGLVIRWTSPQPEQVREFIDVSLLTVLGPVPRDARLRFLPWPDAIDDAQRISERQGVTSRALVSYALLQGPCTASQCPLAAKSSTPDLTEELPPTLKAATRKRLTECDSTQPAVSGQEISIEALFALLVEAVLKKEKGTIFKKGQWPFIILSTAVVIGIPCVGRVASGLPPFGRTWETWLQVALYVLPIVNHGMPCFGFNWVAVQDMYRRMMLMNSLTALLSLRHSDRKKLLRLPPEVMDLGVLDLQDVETVESFRLLRGLCMDWGGAFSRRIATFMNAFAVVTACVMVWVLLFVELKVYSVLDRTTLLLAIFGICSLGSLIIALALLGEGVNSASLRVVFLLSKHAMALHAGSVRRAGQDEDAGAPPGVAEYITAVAGDIAADQEAHPVKMLGMYCGTSLITALYALPAVWFSRLGNMCVDRPDLCTPDWYSG